MWVAGWLADAVFARRFKLLLFGLFTVAAGLFLWLCCMLDGNFTPFASKVPRTTPLVFVGIALVGFFRAAAVPVLYELAADHTYPLPEGTSAGLIVLAEHTSLLVLLFTVPFIELRTLNLLTLACLASCPIVLSVCRFKYLRKDAEDGASVNNLRVGS